MKRYLHLTGILIGIACFITACGKKQNPTPNDPTPTISDFNPKSAKIGTTVMITGTGFGTQLNYVGIRFGNSAQITPATITPTKLTVVVPDDAETGKIEVEVNTTKITSDATFTLTKDPPPILTITSLSANDGQIGETIEINGTAFGTDTNFVSVSFGGSNVIKPKTVTPTKMTVIVPTSAKTGKIQVTVNGGTPVSSAQTFTLKMSITGFTPKTVTEDDTLKIQGIGFGTAASAVDVYLNTTDFKSVKPIKITDNEIWVIVPYNATSGKVRVATSADIADSKDSFTFLPLLWFNDITPTSARAGQIIKVNGDFYKADPNSITVYFNGSVGGVKPLGIDDANILVRIPLDAKTGKIKIAKTGYATGKSNNPFTVLPPQALPQTGKWVQQADFETTGKSGAFVFTIDNKAYVGGGTTNAPFDGFGSSDMWAYDPTYNAWEQKASFAGGSRTYATGFAIGSKGYVGAGQDENGGYTNDFWEYDPAKNTWTQKANFKGNARGRAVGFSIGGKGYIGLGYNGKPENTAPFKDLYEYNPSSNTWQQKASKPGYSGTEFAFVVSDKAYVGGFDFYAYDPSSDSWTVKASVPNYTFYSGNASCSIGDKGYVGLGYDDSSNSVAVGTNKVYEYATMTNTWKALPNYGGVARSYAVGFTLKDVAYFGLGQPNGGTGTYKDFWAYKP